MEWRHFVTYLWNDPRTLSLTRQNTKRHLQTDIYNENSINESITILFFNISKYNFGTVTFSAHIHHNRAMGACRHQQRREGTNEYVCYAVAEQANLQTYVVTISASKTQQGMRDEIVSRSGKTEE